MKNSSLFLFLALFHPLIRTCYGSVVNELTVVFVSNVVNPNKKELETVTELLSSPFTYGKKPSLLTRFGMMIDHMTIFSLYDIIHSNFLNKEHYSIDHFRNLVDTYQVKNNCTNTSLKQLHTAFRYASENSIILMVANRKPTDTILLSKILEEMIVKTNPVIVFQIESDGSVSRLPTKDMEVNPNNFIPKKLKRNNKTLHEEFEAITELSRNLLSKIALDVLTREIVAGRLPHSINALSQIQDRFKQPIVNRSSAFVYDLVNATNDEIDEIAISMESHFNNNNNNKAPNNVTEFYCVIFSHNSRKIIIDKSSNFEAQTFRAVIKNEVLHQVPTSYTNYVGLLTALQYLPPFSWIVYYANNVKDNRTFQEHILLPKIVQLIFEKRITVKVEATGYGRHWGSKPSNVIYRTIQDASRMARMRFRTSTNWMHQMDIFRERHVETSDIVTIARCDRIRNITMRVDITEMPEPKMRRDVQDNSDV